MADMAAPDQLEMCWRELNEMGVDTAGTPQRAGVIPVTYINSSAAIKAFVGAHGGIVCTSTNAAAVMAWAWQRGEKLLMLPDQHLGRNTAFKMGVPLDRMAVWDPNEIHGGLTPAIVEHAKLLLWKGHCSVHTRFTVQQIDAFRKQHPQGKVIAHPECTFDVVQAADESGSTERIIEVVRSARSGSVWAVATEVHLVNRLAHEVAPDRTVVTLDPFGCLCSTMFRVSPNHLLWMLESLVDGQGRKPDRRPRAGEEPGAARARSDARGREPTPRITTEGVSMAHAVPPLPYDYNALEPHIDEQTMRIHHDKHHAAYVNNLNAALEKYPELQQKSIEDLLQGHQHGAGGHPHRGAQQRRRARQPHAVLGDHGSGQGRHAVRRARRRDQRRASPASTASRSSSPRPASAVSAAAGHG